MSFPDDEPTDIEMAPIGWIHGHEIWAGSARGARAHHIRKAESPSALALEWKVEEERLGSLGAWELRAWMCSRKSGMFSTEREAVLAYVKTGTDGSILVAPSQGAIPDKGGSWVPQAGLSMDARDASGQGALGDAMRAILELGEDGLAELEKAIQALRAAAIAQRGGEELLAKALETLDPRDAAELERTTGTEHPSSEHGSALADQSEQGLASAEGACPACQALESREAAPADPLGTDPSA